MEASLLARTKIELACLDECTFLLPPNLSLRSIRDASRKFSGLFADAAHTDRLVPLSHLPARKNVSPWQRLPLWRLEGADFVASLLLTGCSEYIKALQECHARGMMHKVMGNCNGLKHELNMCLREEVSFGRIAHVQHSAC